MAKKDVSVNVMPDLPAGDFWRVSRQDGIFSNWLRVSWMRPSPKWWNKDRVVEIAGIDTDGTTDADISRVSHKVVSHVNNANEAERSRRRLAGDYPPKKLGN